MERQGSFRKAPSAPVLSRLLAEGGGDEAAVDHVFGANGLRSAVPSVRRAAVVTLTTICTERARASEHREHHRRLCELIASSVAIDRAGGVEALCALLEDDETAPRLASFGAPLRGGMQHTAAVLLGGSPAGNELATLSWVYGELARRGDPEAADAEAKAALEVLSESDAAASAAAPRGGERGERPSGDGRLMAAVLALHQLTLHAPTSIYPHVGTALVLWKSLTCGSVQVRYAAAEALAALVAPGASRHNATWHQQMFDAAHTALEREGAGPAVWHGGQARDRGLHSISASLT
jgi:hypothetical protein